VLLFHAFGHPSGGFYGVDVFFVLSGFLITTLLLDEHAQTGRISLRGFYERGARRLLPALGGFLLFVGLLLSAEPIRAAKSVVAGTFYVTNVLRAAGTSQTLPLVGHLWSLAEEEQFYVLWPALLILALRWRPHLLARFLGALLVAALLYRTGLLVAGATHQRVYFAPDTHADPLLIGCLLAVVVRTTRVRVTPALAIAAAGMLALLAATTLQYSTLSLQLGTPLVEVSAAVLILAGLQPGHVQRLLAVRPLVWFGTIFYSLYLWQQLVYKLSGEKGWVMVPVAIAVAWLSYRYVEEPFRRRRAAPEPHAALPSAAPAN
jgi:peptidoglycan/LPS O-acetylase OafA/YrhL